MGTKTLVALDTNHIKQYVFPTDKLKEIRGASSLLDRLNRDEMQKFISQSGQKPFCVYANGGAGMFVVDTADAQAFCQFVERIYREKTAGGASIACAKLDIPKDMPDDEEKILDVELKKELELLRYLLQAKKNCMPASMVLPSHPFLRTCDACGMLYAEDRDRTGARDPDERERLYCASCLTKRNEDKRVREELKERKSNQPQQMSSPLWQKVIKKLVEDDEYTIPDGTERPGDFNDFRLFAGAKEYLGLIYADGNGMGKKTEDFTRLRQWKEFADNVDGSIYNAVCEAIKEHLPVQKVGRDSFFPFDLLLLGGDDVLMVTSADAALDVALTISKQFREITRERDLKLHPELDPEKAGHTLSVGVVLAPIKYPFGLLHELADSTLKHAKKAGVKRCMRTVEEEGVKRLVPFTDEEKKKLTAYGDTFINFMTVAGSISQDFGRVYATLHEKYGRINVNKQEKKAEFYATLRPYTVEEMELLLTFIRKGRKQGLGRTKLHQVREAVLEMNLTTSVGETRAVLRNWRSQQQQFVVSQLQTFAEHCQKPYAGGEKEPGTLFPRVTFPWFANDPKAHIYRTTLLDFVELYDFVGMQGGADAHED